MLKRPTRKRRPVTPDEWWGRPEEMAKPSQVLIFKESAELVISHLRPKRRKDFEPMMRDYIKRCEKRLDELED